MNKQFLNALLCGALVLSAGTFSSCNDDDMDELKGRVSVVEVAINDIKDQLSKALKTGASITNVVEKDGVTTLTLSDGKTITLGGGGNITVEKNENNVIITVNGTEYVLPMGSAANSLVYSPEYADGIVNISGPAVNVYFLATPVVNAAALADATFDIAEAHEVKTRAGSDLFEISGDVTLEGDLIKVPMKATGVEPGKTYAVAIFMNLSGTAISSNYFTVKISDGFEPVPDEEMEEAIGDFEIKASYNANTLADGFAEMTINGAELLKITDFKSLFTTLPDNAEFVVASKGNQPEGKAQEKYDILKKSLAKNGTWAFSSRPGTSFNDNAERKGFLVNVIADNKVKAKIYVMINDELAAVDFTAGLNQAEAEWGGREKSLPMGAQKIDMQATFANWEEDYTIIHNGRAEFYEKWAGVMINTADDDNIVYNDGDKLLLGSIGEDYAIGSRGLYWFYRGFAIYVPEALATDGKYKGTDNKDYSGGEGYGYDFWLGQYNEYIDNPTGFYANVASWNVTIDEKTGEISLPATYTGYGMRIGVGVAYEYAYGVKKIGGADQLGLFFFNRRLAPEGATMPAPKP